MSENPELKNVDPFNEKQWLENHQPIEIDGRQPAYIELIEDLAASSPLKGDAYSKVILRSTQRGLPWLSKSQVLQVYQELCDDGWLDYDPEFVTMLQVKPTRSQAGVTVITVLTKPYPCPGKCIFCPTDVRMPKSYLHDEPGAMRAERYAFDPFDQVTARVEALDRIGHPTDKLELLILGGTWSSYRRDYQEWFIKRCLDAMNGFDSATLSEAQDANAQELKRNVGLVVETRPDHINADELRWFRYLGVTKVQIGIQSLDDRILELNKRGETVADIRQAIRLLRLAGFKIHAHWMPNLLGATTESDIEDFSRLWNDITLRPDELKIYPCMLVENAELYEWWTRGEYQPYSESEITEVIISCKVQVPPYVRINRIVRDIPTTNIVDGMKKANLRQIAQQIMAERGLKCRCIRCREIRRQEVDPGELMLKQLTYETDATTEYFLSYETDRHIAALLRLSLPLANAELPIPELSGHALIREIHVYGPAVPIGVSSRGDAQHQGLGSSLLSEAMDIARGAGFKRIAVISAIGTQEYYERHDFKSGRLYQTRSL